MHLHLADHHLQGVGNQLAGERREHAKADGGHHARLGLSRGLGVALLQDVKQPWQAPHQVLDCQRLAQTSFEWNNHVWRTLRGMCSTCRMLMCS